MAKSTDFPNEIRAFGMEISKFSNHYYDYDIFTDFIDYMICCFRYHGHPETVERLKTKYKNDYPKFFELYKAFIECQSKNLGGDFDWFDSLGMIYETISSSSKASALGQFFTPKPVCDLMAQITIEKQEKTETKLRVNDCACGSGRTLLAFNRFNPGHELYGEDFDPICAKMATINLALHGCKGQVCNMNSLWPDKWFFGYQINPWQHTMFGIPHIVPIVKEQAFTPTMWENNLKIANQKKEVQISLPAETAIIEPKYKTCQLTLF